MLINFFELLMLISEVLFSGDDLLFLNEFDVIQDVWCYDDLMFDQGEWVIEIKEVDWGFVVDYVGELLCICMKDLWFVVWLIEVFVFEDGIIGFIEGYVLFEGLCCEFWDIFYLLFEDDDIEYWFGNVVWFFGCMVELLCVVLLIDGVLNVFSMFDWEVVQYVVQLIKCDFEYVDDIVCGKLLIEQIDVLWCVMLIVFYMVLLVNLKVFEFVFDVFEEWFVECVGDLVLSFWQVCDVFEIVYWFVECFVCEQGYIGSVLYMQVVQQVQFECIELVFG